MEQSAEEFWKAYEAEIGEPVLARTMGQSFSSRDDRGEWGLIILTPSALRFRETPGENWFASLFKASSSLNREKAKPDLSIPLSDIVSLSAPPRKFLDFLFGSPFFSILIEYTALEDSRQIRFTIDPKSDLPSLLTARLAAIREEKPEA
ncbi:MAG TPA: hypothetical protein VIO60_06525 [Rectinemataceae bacterium]